MRRTTHWDSVRKGERGRGWEISTRTRQKANEGKLHAYISFVDRLVEDFAIDLVTCKGLPELSSRGKHLWRFCVGVKGSRAFVSD
jgi:hypothetical protein